MPQYICSGMAVSKQQVFGINNNEQFADVALQVFRHQAQNCAWFTGSL